MMFFESSRTRLLCLFTLIVAASLSFAQSSTVTGSVAYRERLALPSDAVIDVQLIDTSVADIATQTVAEALINAEGRQVPVPFTLTYDPAKIVPANRYSVRATIRSGDGMLMFSSTQAYPVLTHGAPSKVDLLLHTVGHAWHSKAAAKMKELAAPAAETAPPAAAESTTSTKTAETTSESEAVSSAAAVPRPTEQPPVKQETEPPAPPVTPTESAAAPPSPNPAASETPPPTEPVGQAPAPQSAPPAQETAPPTPSAVEQPAPPAESPAMGTAPATPEVESSSRESKPAESKTAEAQPAAPQPTVVEPAPAPEVKASQPEAPLPEAPSASKRAELAATSPAPEDEVPEPAAAPPAARKDLTPLADTQWKLIQLGGQEVVITPPQKPVTLAFSPEGRRIAGSAGCNSYLGTFTDDHGRLHLNPGNMTMMFCADPAGSREKKFIVMLRSAESYRISGDFLILTSNGTDNCEV